MIYRRFALRPLVVTVIVACMFLGNHEYAWAGQQQALPPISIEMKDVPLREALIQLFTAAKVDYTVPPDLPPVQVSLRVANSDFETVLKNMLASVNSPSLHFSYRVNGSVYTIEVHKIEPEVAESASKQIYPMRLMYITPTAAIGLARTFLRSDAVIVPAPNGNGLLVRTTAQQFEEIRNAIAMGDLESTTMTVRASVVYLTSKGKRTLLESTMIKTTQDQEASSDEESTGTLPTQKASLHFQANPHLQGNGAYSVKTVWDISLPLGQLGIAKSNVRLSKRLTTSTQVLPQKTVIVGEVSGEQWGGDGKIILELSVGIPSTEPGGVPGTLPR